MSTVKRVDKGTRKIKIQGQKGTDTGGNQQLGKLGKTNCFSTSNSVNCTF